MTEFVIRFLVGGLVVSLFAAMGDTFQPKRFAGLAGAAPSVALASLALAFHGHESGYVALEGRSMVFGALAFLAYAAACVFVASKKDFPIGLGAALAWTVWFAIAGVCWAVVARFA